MHSCAKSIILNNNVLLLSKLNRKSVLTLAPLFAELFLHQKDHKMYFDHCQQNILKIAIRRILYLLPLGLLVLASLFAS